MHQERRWRSARLRSRRGAVLVRVAQTEKQASRQRWPYNTRLYHFQPLTTINNGRTGRLLMTPGQRIALIQESAELLAKHDYDYIDLVLGQFALPTSDYWQGTKTGYVVAMIKDATDKALNELHTFVTGQADLSKPGQTPWSGTKLRLFCSHLAMHRETVGEVRDASIGMEWMLL